LKDLFTLKILATSKQWISRDRIAG